jgi:hypothetical protein
MNNEDPLMDDEQAGDAVARYLEENPELLQGIVPEHDLWPAIESRISARVLPMRAPAARGARRQMGWIPTLIAASALIAGTAGITYVLTTRVNHSGTAAQVASGGTNANGSAASDAQQNTQSQPTQPSQVANNPIGRSSASPSTDTQSRDAQTRATQAQSQKPAAQLASHGDDHANDPARKTYDAEIASLHTILEGRRGQLNPATVAVIEQNLKVIDDAIHQSMEALAKDPNSRLLNDQLDRTLAQKTVLLRAAVLLPAA